MVRRVLAAGTALACASLVASCSSGANHAGGATRPAATSAGPVAGPGAPPAPHGRGGAAGDERYCEQLSKLFAASGPEPGSPSALESYEERVVADARSLAADAPPAARPEAQYLYEQLLAIYRVYRDAGFDVRRLSPAQLAEIGRTADGLVGPSSTFPESARSMCG